MCVTCLNLGLNLCSKVTSLNHKGAQLCGLPDLLLLFLCHPEKQSLLQVINPLCKHLERECVKMLLLGKLEWTQIVIFPKHPSVK